MPFSAIHHRALDASGNLITGTDIRVKREVPGQPFPVLKADRDGNSNLNNPTIGGFFADGKILAYVAGGSYQVEVLKNGLVIDTFPHVAAGLAAETDNITTPGVAFDFDVGIADADPGAGKLRANNASLAAATFLYVSKFNRAGDNVSAWLLALSGRNIVLDVSGGASQVVFTVGGVTDASGYVKLAVTGHSGATGIDAGVVVGMTAGAGSTPIASVTDVLTGTDITKAATPDAVAGLWERGGDIASAATISIGEGGYFHVTGTTTITDIDFATPKNGRSAILIFDAALTLTHHATTLQLPGGVNIATAAGDRCKVVQDNGDNVVVVWYERAAGAIPVPTRQVLTSGTGATYNTPVGCRQLRIRMIGGGGGGGAAVTNAGANGTATVFNSIAAAPGSGGAQGPVGQGGLGGTGGAGAASLRITGGDGGQGGSGQGASSSIPGPHGGVGAFGGAGKGGVIVQAGFAAKANSGAGGGGGNQAGGQPFGSGGGAGEYVELIINTPAASYTYTVGGGGAGGTAGSQAGGAGGSGIIIVDEFY